MDGEKIEMKPNKLSSMVDSEFVPHSYDNIWEIEQTTGPQRLVIAPSADQIDLLIKLARVLPEPFGVLYVLLVPRKGNQPGRYQCPRPCSRSEMESFLLEFKDYFESDGRHHVWVMSLPESSTLVYDQHNIIFAYGPLQEFTEILNESGFREGPVSIPSPHAHNYNAENDDTEERLLNHWAWIQSPLQPGDEL